jgi:hypothetical protein
MKYVCEVSCHLSLSFPIIFLACFFFFLYWFPRLLHCFTTCDDPMQHISILLLVFSTVVLDVCSGNLFTRLNVDLKGLGLVHFHSYELGDGIYSGKYFLDSQLFWYSCITCRSNSFS